MTIDLDPQTLTIIGGGGVLGIGGLIWSIGRRIESAQSKEACGACRQERREAEAQLRSDLQRKADSESFVRLETQFEALSRKVDEVHADLRRLLQRPGVSRASAPFEEEG